MKALWTFETREKLDKFLPIVDEHDIAYELSSTGSKDTNITISVDENDYTKAKRLLLKHRKRRTSSDR